MRPSEASGVAGALAAGVLAEALALTASGLRAVYWTLELPGKDPLKDAHAALDAAVLAACGFDAKKDVTQDCIQP